MKKKLSIRETVVVASTLFGMFFGAGNLIFPVHLGQLAGSQVWPATLGFIVTAVGIPILGVAALGITHSDDMLALSGKVSRWYAYALTCALYLTIGYLKWNDPSYKGKFYIAPLILMPLRMVRKTLREGIFITKSDEVVSSLLSSCITNVFRLFCVL